MSVLEQRHILQELKRFSKTSPLLSEINHLRSSWHFHEDHHIALEETGIQCNLQDIFNLPKKYGASIYRSLGVAKAYEIDLDQLLDCKAENTESVSLFRSHLAREVDPYLEARKYIHTHYRTLKLDVPLLQKLHGLVMKNSPNKLPGQWRPTFNPPSCYNPFTGEQEILRGIPDAEQVPNLMDALFSRFNSEYDAGEIDPLILIASLIIEIYRIHPFKDGNGRTSRLIFLLLLYQAGHPIGRFISLENFVQETLQTRNWAIAVTLNPSFTPYHILPWVEYFLEVIKAAYRGLLQAAKFPSHK